MNARTKSIRPERRAGGGKANKLDVIRARCDHDLKSLVLKAAERLGLDEADVVRLGARDYAARVVFQSPDLAPLAAH